MTRKGAVSEVEKIIGRPDKFMVSGNEETQRIYARVRSALVGIVHSKGEKKYVDALNLTRFMAVTGPVNQPLQRAYLSSLSQLEKAGYEIRKRESLEPVTTDMQGC